MATPRSRRSERAHEHEPEHKYERRPDREPEHSGDDPRRHTRILERRWLGSPPPTSELYARALRQWRALPGAVVSPATDAAGVAETAPAADSSADQSAP